MIRKIVISFINGDAIEIETNIPLCNLMDRIEKTRQDGKIFFVISDEYFNILNIIKVNYKEEKND